MTKDEWRSLCNRVTDQMKVYTRPFVTPVIQDITGKPASIGTGSYVSAADNDFGRTWLLTCEHVARCLPMEHVPFDEMTPKPLKGILYSDREPADVATIKLPSDFWDDANLRVKPVPIDRFDVKHEPIADEILFFRGQAGENAYLSFQGIDTILSGYGSQEIRDSGDEQQFEIFWEPENTTITSGTDQSVAERVRFDEAKGFSGSLVWNTRFVEKGCDLSQWNPDDAVVTGLLRRWDQSTRSLLAWRVVHLRKWLSSRPGWAV